MKTMIRAINMTNKQRQTKAMKRTSKWIYTNATNKTNKQKQTKAMNKINKQL
jgi:hypothetical protein